MQISQDLNFRSIEEPDIDLIYKQQNGPCFWELGSMFDQEEPWIPMTFKLVKEKLEEMQKGENSHIFGIWTPRDEFIGIATYHTRWDPVCPDFAIILWPEFRRKGFGTKVAEFMLDNIFNQYHGHMVTAWINDWDEIGQSFIASLGFKPAGAFRRAYVRDGKYSDILIFDILKSEYLAHIGENPLEVVE